MADLSKRSEYPCPFRRKPGDLFRHVERLNEGPKSPKVSGGTKKPKRRRQTKIPHGRGRSYNYVSTKTFLSESKKLSLASIKQDLTPLAHWLITKVILVSILAVQ
jgi:hypothetical protein